MVGAKELKLEGNYDPFRDGVSYSHLAAWKECREKSRLMLQGWTPKTKPLALTFGTILHSALEMAYRDLRACRRLKPRSYVRTIENIWREENRLAAVRTEQDFEMSLLFTESVLPTYFKFWHRDSHLKWVDVEGKFDVPWPLPDGSKVRLIGRRDGLFSRPGQKGLWLLENKTSSRIDEQSLIQRIPFEDQSMLYMASLSSEQRSKVNGVLYNVIRRPQLRQKAKESLAAFARRCASDVDKRRDFYFLRLEIAIGHKEIARYSAELTAQLWDFVRWWRGDVGHYKNTGACESKYGPCLMLPICSEGRTAGFFKRKRLLSRLEN